MNMKYHLGSVLLFFGIMSALPVLGAVLGAAFEGWAFLPVAAVLIYFGVKLQDKYYAPKGAVSLTNPKTQDQAKR
jgi:hypothetical protein